MIGNFLIFGGAGGIGSALCQRLTERGAQVLAVGRDEARLQQLAAGTGAQTFVGDATQPSSVQATFARAMELFGKLDGVANCVGSILLKPAHLTTDDDWTSTLATNLTSSFLITREAARTMINGGSVVLVSTAAARTGIANHEAIAAAKGGVISLALSAAATYAPRNLRFNCVAPGLTQTPLSAKLLSSEAARKASTQMHALGRLGQPDDVASAIEWLLDPANGWITGQVIGVDGGLATVRPRVAG